MGDYTEIKTSQWVVTICVIIVLIIIGIVVFGGEKPEIDSQSDSQPQKKIDVLAQPTCDDYGYKSLRDLPVKCYEYYHININGDVIQSLR